MSWGHPEYFWLLLLIVALGAARIIWARAIRRAYAGIGAGEPSFTRAVGARRERARAWMLWLGLSALVLAMASPRWGAREEKRQSTGADVLLVIDCSRSMLATDFYPTRMEAARRKAITLLHLAPEMRMALMPFAGTSVLRCPLTGDQHALELMLQDCSPDLFPAKDGYQGTAIGDAVQMAVQVLDRQVERGQAVLVISDGADEDKDAVRKAADKAKALGIAVYGLFLGDKDREVPLEIDGKTENMKSDSATLDDLATASGGISVSATNDDADVKALHEHIQAHIAQTPWEERQRVVQSERYQIPLLAGIALIAAGALMPTRRRIKESVELAEAA